MIEVTASDAQTRLVLKRVFPATRERVFDAWTTPAIMQTFMNGCGSTLGSKIDVDLRVGGNYRIAMKNAEDEENVAVGTYQVIDRPNLLVCTWRWVEDAPELEHETLLTLEFADVSGGTELTLTHERFKDSEQRDRHNEGWSTILEKSAMQLAG